MTEEQVRKIVNEEITKLLLQLKYYSQVQIMDGYFMSDNFYKVLDMAITERIQEVEDDTL